MYYANSHEFAIRGLKRASKFHFPLPIHKSTWKTDKFTDCGENVKFDESSVTWSLARSALVNTTPTVKARGRSAIAARRVKVDAVGKNMVPGY